MRRSPDPRAAASARGWVQRRTGATTHSPEALAMNDLDIVCKGIVIVGLAAPLAAAVRS
jgi:hypothetical protein